MFFANLHIPVLGQENMVTTWGKEAPFLDCVSVHLINSHAVA